jgi:hypothetical protein
MQLKWGKPGNPNEIHKGLRSLEDPDFLAANPADKPTKLFHVEHPSANGQLPLRLCWNLFVVNGLQLRGIMPVCAFMQRTAICPIPPAWFWS